MSTTPQLEGDLTMNTTHHLHPPTLDPAALRIEARRTLAAPRRRGNPLTWLLFLTMDVLYRRRGSLEKFLVLEHLAQVPYRSWERVAQRRIDRTHGQSKLARRIQQRVDEARAQHDNEQWHMLVIEDLLAGKGARLGRFRFRILPRLIAGPWQLFTWLLHLVTPSWSYVLNASFEDHAERDYMNFVAANPEFEAVRFTSDLADRWRQQVSVADVLRQIGHDERCHKLESIAAAEGRVHAHELAPEPAVFDAEAA
jgi:ubiquinol oxidase